MDLTYQVEGTSARRPLDDPGIRRVLVANGLISHDGTEEHGL
jgi:hypothetical protein